ncbi:hypothetical protein MCAP1_002466 [Malassezia caprae]|uniref:Tetratricopeptide repeat protein 39B n=1 Tax=Malassezia caprae TaxID=1381934 RepID=A0AAF0ECW0_9BASI|nr:hypothetical protein MCAP1_002466 [Malassezia caprae]
MAKEQLLPSALENGAFVSKRRSSLTPDTVLSSGRASHASDDRLPISLTDQVLRQNVLHGRTNSVRGTNSASGQRRRSMQRVPSKRTENRSMASVRPDVPATDIPSSHASTSLDDENLSDNDDDFFDAMPTASSSVVSPNSSAPVSRAAPVQSETPRRHMRTHDSQLLASNAKGRADRMSKLTFSDVKQSTDELFADIAVARKALHLFLNSRMNEAYELIEAKSESRLYYAVAYAILSTIKAIMTFEHQDLGTAISHCKDALHVAGLLRKKQSAFATIGRFVRGAGPSVTWVSSMTPVEQHAELVSSECTLLKAVLGIAYSGDLLSSLTEALHLRAAYGDYRSLLKYVEWAESNGANNDEDFRSGVFLGSGCISLILGLLPSKVLKIMEIFGYEGSVPVGLSLLQRAAGWSGSSTSTPRHTIDTEGIRSPICDMTLLMYHLVVSTFIPVPDVDVAFAEKVLLYHLRRYPEGVFFLYFHGRLYSTQALSVKAVECFKQARDVQEEYVQLKHICYWDMALCYMSLNEWSDAYECMTVLANENNWSKALYSYARAAALYQTSERGAQDEAKDIMERVPSMTQRIAGKSIPLEKFAARKSRKMGKYGYLCLPALEMAYLTHCFTTAPPKVLVRRTLPMIEEEISRLQQQQQPKMDDLCLAYFLQGVVLRNVAYPEKHVKTDDKWRPMRDAAARAETSLLFVATNAVQCDYDHYLLYFCHYELGRLYISMGRADEAIRELELVLSGKNLGDHGRKGKYSMQNMCVLRSNAARALLPGSASH